MHAISHLLPTLPPSLPPQPCTCSAFAPTATSSHALTSDAVQGRHPTSPSPSLQLVAGYEDGSLRTFDVGGVRMVQRVRPHSAPLTVVTYSIDGERESHPKLTLSYRHNAASPSMELVC